MTIILNQDGEFVGEMASLEEAVQQAKRILSATPPGDKTTLTVEDDYGYIFDVLSNRRITGVFSKYEMSYGQRLLVGQLTFDATYAVLSMKHSDLLRLQDDAKSSTQLGQRFAQWSEPCSVSIVSSILEYFCVDDLTDIPPEALRCAYWHTVATSAGLKAA